MIPMVAAVSINGDREHGFRLWIPLALVWLLLLPIVLLLLPLALLACALGAVNPLRAMKTFWDILSALNGLDIEVQSVQVHVF
jgi:hypothetical protein